MNHKKRKPSDFEPVEKRKESLRCVVGATTVRVILQRLVPNSTIVEKEILIDRTPFLLGRHSDCDFAFVGISSVSTLHCVIECATSDTSFLPRIALKDNCSLNGVFHNDVRVSTAVLQQGDIITLAGGKGTPGKQKNAIPLGTRFEQPSSRLRLRVLFRADALKVDPVVPYSDNVIAIPSGSSTTLQFSDKMDDKPEDSDTANDSIIDLT
ncbi:MAG: hypothetical protein MHM6MM_003228 [Cercozoa sp. M6MM]